MGCAYKSIWHMVEGIWGKSRGPCPLSMSVKEIVKGEGVKREKNRKPWSLSVLCHREPERGVAILGYLGRIFNVYFGFALEFYG